MKPETTRHFFAIACGILVGTLLANSAASYFHLNVYLRITAAILGATISWPIVDFTGFKSGVAKAWNESIGWRPDKVFWSTMLAGTINGASFGCMFIELFAIALIFVTPTSESYMAQYGMVISSEISITCGSIIGFFCALVSHGSNAAMPEFPDCEGWPTTKGRMEESNRSFWYWAKLVNPISFNYCLIVGILKGIRAIPSVLVKIPSALQAIGQFLKLVLVNTQAQGKAPAAFVFAAIGALIGHFYIDSPIAMAVLIILGAGIGTIEYELATLIANRLKESESLNQG